MNPTIIRSGPHLVAETYTISLNNLGTFDTTDAGVSNALFILMQYSRPTTNNADDITAVQFNGVNATLVQKTASLDNSNRQPRMALYVVTNPTKLVAGVISASFNVNVTDSNTMVSAYPILMRDVNQTTPIGYNSTGNIAPIQDLVLFDDHWDISIPAQGGNSTIFGAYLGRTTVRNGFVARGDTVELSKGIIDLATNIDYTYWIGTREVTYNGLIEFEFSQTVYPDTNNTFVFEVMSSDVIARSVLPYSISIGTNPVITFSNLVGSPPTSMTLSCGGLSQPVSVVDNAGTYTVSMPTLSSNAVMLGEASLTFIDNGTEIKSVFNYNALPLRYLVITATVNEAVYSSWTTKPRVGDLLIYDNATTSVTNNGDLEAYNAGTYSYSIFRKLEGITETFSVTFNESFTFSIDDANSTSNISLNQLAHVTLSNDININPAWVGIENVNTGVIYPQQEFSYSSSFKTLSYRVVIPNYNSGHTYILRAYAEDGTYDALPVIIVAATPAVDNRTDYLPSLLSLAYGISTVEISPTVIRNNISITISASALLTANGLTLGGRNIASLAGAGGTYSFTIPPLASGLTLPLYSSTSPLSLTNGTDTESAAFAYLPPSTMTYITLSSVTVSPGYVGNYITCAVGDQIIFDTSATRGVLVNLVTASGAIQTDYSGTQTMWHISAATGLVSELTVITPAGVSVIGVNSGTIYADGSNNTITTLGLPTATGATLGSYAISGLTGTNNSYGFTLPTLANGVTSPLFGSRVFTITDGTNSPTLNINVLPAITLDYITLTGSGGTGLGYIGNTITCVAGDQIIFSKPATLSITENGVSADGSIFTDYSGTQTMYHRRVSDGLITEFSVLTSVVSVDKTPTSAVITPVTNAVLSQSYTSTGITVSGMDAGIDVACTITGGDYEISTNGGSSWSAPASIAGTIRNGYMFRLTGTASNLNNTVRNVVFSVGEGTITNFTFVITTVAAPRTINLANKLVRNLVSPLYDTKVTTSKTETVPSFIPGNNTTLLHSSVVNNTSVWLLNVPNFTTATIKLKQNITKAKGNIQVQINNTTGLSVGNNKLYLCKLNSSNAILTFKRVNINIT